ncbi:MAG: bifunctional DNA-formamidopyrimidine glycosylase/DNA-(apurinic or apyrimidinic site) lyase [Clostridiaceae bacterium]|nr:bifunctional DNA-formamidopyrimidine glycosylase/DNA-(apurinic or apyrimidinic site) lyase [Clostridiaceae bacterium]
MPELPEVETIRRTLIDKIQNKFIEEIICYHPDVLVNPDDISLKNWLIKDIRRRGKYLLFDLEKANPDTLNINSDNILKNDTDFSDNNYSTNYSDRTAENSCVMMVHLRMTGKLLLEESIVEPAKHTHVRFVLSNGGSLDFNDTRRFGRVTLFSPGDEYNDHGFATLGPEPLGDDFTADYLINTCKRYGKSTIKGVLLNQQAIAGIGNIYADESLFRAGIIPNRKAGEISQSKIKLLRQKIREVIAEAIGHRGTSFRDYVDGLGNKGFFQLQLAVYQKDGKPCASCGTTIEKIKVAGRSTHFCPHCQK